MVCDGPCHYPKVQVSAAPHSQTLGTQQQDLVSTKASRKTVATCLINHFCWQPLAVLDPNREKTIKA